MTVAGYKLIMFVGYLPEIRLQFWGNLKSSFLWLRCFFTVCIEKVSVLYRKYARHPFSVGGVGSGTGSPRSYTLS